MNATDAGPEPEAGSVFLLTRRFAAPRRLVWRAWTDAAHLAQWWGPVGCTLSHCVLDLKIGGLFHYCMSFPGRGEMWGKFVFREIAEPERLVFLNCNSDPDGATVRSPFVAVWPLETLATVTFVEHGGGTEMTLRWEPHNASEAERRAFAAGMETVRGGWTSSFDRLDSHLTETSR